MATFFKIFFFFLLKLGVSGKEGIQLPGSDTAMFERILSVGGTLYIEGKSDMLDEAIAICQKQGPVIVNRDVAEEIPGISRAALVFNELKPFNRRAMLEELMQRMQNFIFVRWVE